MNKPDHVYVAVTEEYRKLREIQTFINQMVWSTELCYAHFLDGFESKTTLQRSLISQLFKNLPLQAWFKNKSGTGKYDLTLKKHNDVVKANQLYVYRSAIILYNSYFDEYLKNRVNSRFQLFRNLTNHEFKTEKVKLKSKNIFKADCCRIIRNWIVHEPANKFISIREIRSRLKQELTDNLKKRAPLFQAYTEKEIIESLNQAINEVIDSAISEVENNSRGNIVLPYEFFFMLYTFTNYNQIAAEIEQVLYYDDIPKTFYNRVHSKNVSKERIEMITAPSVIGCVYDFTTKKPIEFATVQVLDNPFNGESDKDGNYHLSPNLKSGKYEIEIYADAYATERLSIITESGATKTINIRLRKH